MSRTSAGRASAGQRQFATINKAVTPRSSLQRDCTVTTTMDSGYLVPIFTEECYPGDTMNLQCRSFVREATLLKPIMSTQVLKVWFWAIPIRLVWDNWKAFMGEKVNPDDNTDYLTPMVEEGVSIASQSVSDYMGWPAHTPNVKGVAFWHRAYNLTYSEWYRAQFLQDSAILNTGDGPDVPGDYPLRRIGKMHDYFTSCNPWPQAGPEVTLPLGSYAPVVSDAVTGTGAGIPLWGTGNPITGAADASAKVEWGISVPPNVAQAWNASGLVTDLLNATSASVNAWRESVALQQMLELEARAGQRYTEQIRAFFGVESPDSRQQRPEFLGGGTTTISVNPVASTYVNNTPDSAPQGDLSAFVTGGGGNGSFVKSFTEHCVVLGLAAVRSDLVYQQGMERKFSRRKKYDYYFPQTAHLGEQAVLNQEIYWDDAGGENENVFGYQEAWADLRYKPSLITGKMRSSDPQSLDLWHLGQDFAELPLLNDEFIQEDPPIDRCVAVPSEPTWLADFAFKYKHVRPLPVNSNPGLRRM